MKDVEYLVTGATGETGRETVRRLLEAGHSVRAMVRTMDHRADRLAEQGAKVVNGDFLDHDALIRATDGVTAAYFCYPVRPGLIQATAYFADAARRANVRLVVNMSQISAREDSQSHAARDHWIGERTLDNSGVPTTHLRPTFFAQWLLYARSRSTIVNEGMIDLPYGEGRHAPIAAEDQARFISALLVDPLGHVGKTYSLHGPIELSQAEIAERVGSVLGRRVDYKPTSIAQYRERLEAAGLPPFLVQHFCAIAVDYQNGIFSGEDSIIEAVTGSPPMTVEAFVEAHRGEFQPA